MEYICISESNRAKINQFIKEHWYSTKMAVRGQEFDMTEAEGVVACNEGQIVGLITYVFRNRVCEIMSLDSLTEKQGIGTALLNMVIQKAKEKDIQKIILITTNDNINAIRFYQRRGFDMVNLYRNMLDVSRKLKPEIPLIGENEIPLRHEIEFEMIL